MAIASADIQFRLSGGASNTDPDSSLGGVISSTEIVSATLENLFDNVTASESANGDTEYRCLYVLNTNTTDSFLGVVIWIDTQTASPDTDIAIGLDGGGVGDGSSTGVAVTITDEGTAPAGVSFSTPNSASTGLTIGDLGPGQAHAVWIKRNVAVGAAQTSLDDCRIQVRGYS